MAEIIILENDVKSFQTPMEAEMLKAIKHFESELLKIRTGRAHTSLVEDIVVMGYNNAPMPIKQVASITAPDPKLIIIESWDPSLIESIEKGLTNSDVGVTPVNDGKIIRIALPNMSSTRRDELIKILHKKLNDCKERIRDVRKDFNNLIRDAKKNKKISENFFSRLEDVLQKIVDKFTAQADQLSTKKEQDIKSV